MYMCGGSEVLGAAFPGTVQCARVGVLGSFLLPPRTVPHLALRPHFSIKQDVCMALLQAVVARHPELGLTRPKKGVGNEVSGKGLS